MSSVFVTGATGFVGQYLIQSLAKQGEEIKVLVREGSDHKLSRNKNMSVIYGDVRNSESFSNELEGVETIYHLAGVVTDWAPRSQYYEVHEKGTRNVVEAAINCGVKRIVYLSTVDVLAYEKHSPLNENTPYTSSNVGYRSSKVQAEKLLFKYARKKKIDVVILRPVWVYGVGDKVFIPEIARQMHQKSMFFIGSSSNYVSLVHVRNLAQAILNAGQTRAVNEAFLVYDKELTWDSLTQQISRSLNAPKPRITLPYNLAHFLGHTMELVFQYMPKRPPLTRTAVETIGYSVKFNTNKAKRVLDYKQKVSFEKGMSEVFDWLNEKNNT